MSESNKDQQIESLEEKVTHLSRMLVKSFGYADQDPDIFLQNARRTTEAICRFIYTKELGEPKGKMMLNDYGRELLQKKIIPDKIGILIGTIQTYGNYAAHAQDDLSEATREWIAPCQTALASLTNWFFLEYLKGNVPNELITPVQNFFDSSSNKGFSKNTATGSKKSTLPKIILISIVVLGIGIVVFYFLNNTASKNIQTDQALNVTENVVKQQEDIVDNLNTVTPNENAKRIAILYFDNGSDNAELSRLRKGLSDMLISDLSKIKMLNVIERARLEEILKEQKLNNSKEFDASTATKVGKLLGVQYILTGAFFDLMGSMRMDARIIDVETGKIIKSDGIDGPTNTFFDLEKKLVVKIAGGLNVELEDEKTKNAESKQTSLSYETSLLFSDGLDKMDKGEKEKAIELFKKVLQKNPDFIPAQQALHKLMAKV